MKEVIYNFFKFICSKFSSFFKRLAGKRRITKLFFKNVRESFKYIYGNHLIDSEMLELLECWYYDERDEN